MRNSLPEDKWSADKLSFIWSEKSDEIQLVTNCSKEISEAFRSPKNPVRKQVHEDKSSHSLVHQWFAYTYPQDPILVIWKRLWSC